MPRLSLDDLYRFAVPSDPRLRPDGGAVAYTLTTPDRDTDENRTEIWLAAPGSPPRRLATGSAARWSPDGRTLAFVRPVDGKPQIHLLPMDGGEPYALTSAALGAGAPQWSPDGTRIAYSGPAGPEPDPHAPVVADRLEYKADGSGLLRGLTTQLFVVDVAGGETRQVTEGDFHAGEPSWAPDGTRLAFVADMEGDRDLEIGGAVHSIEVDGGVPERLTDPEIICSGVWWLGERLVVAGLKGTPVGHVRLFTLGPGGVAEVETGLDRNVMTGHPGYPGAAPALLGDDLLFCARDRGRTHLYRAPADRLVPKNPEDVSVSGVSVAAGRVAYVAATPYSAGDVHLDGERLTDHGLGDIDLYVPISRTFTAPDGTEVEGFLLRDETAETPGPLLLDVHGGPHNAWAPVLDGFHLYHQALAAQGWTVLALNPRASDGYGEDFYTAAVGAWGLADTQDFLAAVDALVADGTADPERLAVTGYSYGGYMTCWLTAGTGRFKAAIAGGCVSDLTSMSGTSDMGHLLKTHECAGDLAAQSPMTHVAGVTTPTLLLHGENDDRCPVGQAEQWFAALRERRVPVRLVRYPGAAHLFIVNGRPSHRYDYNERIIAWLEQWISGSPS
ncbi:Dipeptidyl aminopeptidase/acylaminoacyl peptidase [Nonomuraea solani]|uniref:Acyl-peptide hydrolase n=1 Tax=Nonomuraea solani TaxID=1144553 RepID=A0A1H6EHI1_9ACTN|nr:S9 family peptidase [Nonomuraea solani]SEG97288.1 Dipeptidyl aminopeptidase/acylaminoacyl peptidase [Nonomuraea solani]